MSKNFSTEIYWFPFNQLPLPEGILNLLAPKVMDNLFPKLSVDEMVGKWRAAGDELYVREVNFDENGKWRDFFEEDRVLFYFLLRKTGEVRFLHP